MLGLSGCVPLIVFGLWGGAVADAVDRRMLLIVSATLDWLVTGGLLVQALLDVWQPWPDPGAGRRAVGRVRGGLADPQRDPAAAASRAEVPAANTLSFTSATSAWWPGRCSPA